MSADPPPPVDITSLVARAAGGDRRAAETLILVYRRRVARFVIGETRDAAQYEDLCQSVFVKMVLALPRLRDASRFEPWLFQIARNVCRDHLRARSGWRRLFVAYAPEHERVSSPPTPNDDADALTRHIDALPEAQRTLLRLSLDERRSYEELARLSRSSVSAVKSRLHRARENLRALLLAEDP